MQNEQQRITVKQVKNKRFCCLRSVIKMNCLNLCEYVTARRSTERQQNEIKMKMKQDVAVKWPNTDRLNAIGCRFVGKLNRRRQMERHGQQINDDKKKITARFV